MDNIKDVEQQQDSNNAIEDINAGASDNIGENKAEESADNKMEKSTENITDISTENKKVKKKINWKKEIISWVILIAVAYLMAKVITEFVIIKAEIPSGSMKNTIMKDDLIVGNRLAYLFGEPERGDIIIFKLPDDETQTYIKRCIGLPGETLNVIDGKVYIDDSTEPLDEPYIREEMIGSFGPYEIPEDCYFMMGDNRNSSEDARYWDIKYVNRSQIVAKAWFRYSPTWDFLK